MRLGHKVDVYSATGVRFEAGNLRSIPVKSFGGKHLENISRSALATLHALGHYDVIHFHAIGPGVLSLLTATLRQKSAVTIHGLDWRRAKWNAAARFSPAGGAEQTLDSMRQQGQRSLAKPGRLLPRQIRN